MVRVAALCIALCLGCAEDRLPTLDETASRALSRRRPLVTFHPDPRVRIATQGDPQMQWLQVEGSLRRSFVCSRRCSLTFRAGSFRGGRLEVVAASGDGSVRFAMLSRHAGEDFEEVWAADLGSRESRRLRFPIPDTPAAELKLVSQGPTEAAKAFWVEPTLVVDRDAGIPPAASPNVVLITSDTTRQDELGVYGGRTQTPEIDRLAAEGVVFEDAYSVAFATNPSHASLMTSTHAATHGVDHNSIILGSTLPTLAEVLAEQGWATAAFVSAVVLTRRAGFYRGFDLYDDSFGVERRGDRTVSLFEQWLSAHARAPFFVWIHLYDPHQPYRPPAGRADPYLDGLAPDAIARVDALIEAVRSYAREGYIEPRSIETAFDAQFLDDLERVARARYRGEIAFVDEQVGRIRAALEKQDLLDDTLVVFTADHGENFLDRGSAMAYDHTGVRADVSRVPLVLRPVGGQPRGRSKALVANIDIAPTIALLAGVEAPPSWTGRPLLSREGQLLESDRDHLVIEGSHRREASVRTPSWLYRELREWAREDPRIGLLQGYAPQEIFELYDRAADPDEFTSTYRPNHPEVARLRGWLAAFDESQTRQPVAPQLDPDQLRALEALGYRESLEPSARVR
jgi:arylsulfatase A-like enzyme